MFKKILVAAATGLIVTSAFAVDTETVVKSYELKDGSTVHIYKDGKMAMEDKVGTARMMKEGQVMETKDGQKIMMKGSEVWRLEAAHKIHTGN